MKRYTLLMITCIILITSTSCKKKDEPLLLTEDKTKISFCWQGNDANNERILKVNNIFNRNQSELFTVGAFGNWEPNDFENFVNEQIENGMPIDLVQSYSIWFERIIKNQEKHHFLDLNTIPSDLLDLSSFSEEIIEYCTINEELIGVPYTISVPLFYWNTTVFKKTKVDIPNNLEELLASGEKIQEAISDSYYPLAMDEKSRILFLTTYLEQSTGKKWCIGDNFPYTIEEVQSALSLLKEMETRHVIPTLNELAASEELATNDNWIYGKYGGIYTWSSSATTYEKMLANASSFRPDYEFANMGDYNLTYYQIDRLLSITKTSSLQQETATYLNFLLHDKQMVKIMGEIIPFFGNEEANNIGVKKKYFPKDIQKVHKRLQKNELHLITDYIKEETGEPYTIMIDIITGTSNETYDIEEASKKMVEEMKKIK